MGTTMMDGESANVTMGTTMMDGESANVTMGTTMMDGESANVTMGTTMMDGESPVVGTVPDNLDLHDAVYNTLLSRLELSAKHFDDLRKRGLTGEVITANGYKTIDTVKVRVAVDALLTTHGADTLLKVPGFRERNGQVVFPVTTGFLIPVRDQSKHIVAL